MAVNNGLKDGEFIKSGLAAISTGGFFKQGMIPNLLSHKTIFLWPSNCPVTAIAKSNKLPPRQH